MKNCILIRQEYYGIIVLLGILVFMVAFRVGEYCGTRQALNMIQEYIK